MKAYKAKNGKIFKIGDKIIRKKKEQTPFGYATTITEFYLTQKKAVELVKRKELTEIEINEPVQTFKFKGEKDSSIHPVDTTHMNSADMPVDPKTGEIIKDTAETLDKIHNVLNSEEYRKSCSKQQAEWDKKKYEEGVKKFQKVVDGIQQRLAEERAKEEDIRLAKQFWDSLNKASYNISKMTKVPLGDVQKVLKAFILNVEE